MPSISITLTHYFASPPQPLVLMSHNKTLLSNSAQSSPQKESRDDARASIFVFISAQAIGSLGFAMSIFAIWIGWLLPAYVASQPQIEEQEVKKPRLAPKHTRRPPNIRVPPPTPMRRATDPTHITPILTSRPEDLTANSRRVYFEDSQPPAITRRNTMPAPNHGADYLELQNIVNAATDVPLSTSPLAATVTLPSHDSQNDIHPDSDSSPHSSKASLSKSTSRLQKLKLFGHSRTASSHRSEPSERPSDQGSIASTETTSSAEKSARRSSGGFVAGWALSRGRGTLPHNAESQPSSASRLSFARRMSPSRPATSPAPTITPTATTPNPSDLLSPTFLTRKSQKRVSTPIPRTSPYGAPYFAAPPMLLDNNYNAYLKGLPQFEDEMRPSSPQTSEGEPERGRTRTPSIRRVQLDVVKSKQRSASVDLMRRDTIS